MDFIRLEYDFFCCLKSLDGVIACTHRQNRMTCICFVVRKIGQFEWKYRRTFIRYECLRKWKCRCADIFMDILMGCEERFRSRNWMLIYQLNILFLLIFHFFISKQKNGIVIIHDGIDNKWNPMVLNAKLHTSEWVMQNCHFVYLKTNIMQTNSECCITLRFIFSILIHDLSDCLRNRIYNTSENVSANKWIKQLRKSN